MNNLSLAAIVGVQLVQVTLCIAGAALLSFGCLRRRPAFAAAVWLAVLCKCATPPIWASPLGVFSWLRAEKPRTPTQLPSWLEEKTFTPRPTAALADDAPAVTEVASTPKIAWSSIWPWMLAGVWATGFAWTFSRAFVLRRRWLNAVVEDCEPPASLIRAVGERSKRLGMAPPRIVMVAADAGPAASGWFRPTVYLPLGADSKQLESMLVHELVHLRRRDPWLGALQAFVSAAYWFHPFVRWASNELSRCIEEACDAETVRELGCKPVEYATALVALLERRIAPPCVPVVAGMSPARSVRRRLEAVMKTNPNRRGISARGPWLAFAAAALIALPGAGLSPSPPKSEAKPVPTQEILPNPIAPPTATKVESKVPPPLPVDKNFCHRGYDLKPAVDVLVKKCGLREDAAGNAVANLVIAAAEHIGPRPVFAIADQRLFAFAAEAQHEMMRNVIEGTIQEWTVDQIVIETEIWEGPKLMIDVLPTDLVNKENGTKLTFLTEDDYLEISKVLLANQVAKKLATPKLTTLDGQNATLKIGEEYALGGEPDKNGNPRTIPVGVSLDLKPTCSADGKFVSLKVRFEESNLVKFVSQPVAADGKEMPKVPVVSQHVAETTFCCPWGRCVVISAEPKKLLVFKCVKAPKPEANFNIDPPGDGKMQANASERMRVEMELFRRRVKDSVNLAASYPTAVAFLMRGSVSDDQQLLGLERAMGDLFGDIEFVGPNGDKRTISVRAPGGLILQVKMSRVLHDTVFKMVNDLDPRTENEKANGIIPRYSKLATPVGN